ncbi:MAG: hypothetical protein LBQ68_08995, partial [Clostridiales bacterium]|nr:hypothetical protein [Clostridiales bacterium]
AVVNLRGCHGTEQTTKRCLDLILSGRCQAIDIIKVNERYSINIANMGLDAETAAEAAEIKKYFGGMSYIAALIKNTFLYKPFAAELIIDGKPLNNVFTIVAVCNGIYYGGGFAIAPRAKLNDGKLTVCLVRRMPRIKILSIFPLVLFAKHEKLAEVSFVECERVSFKIFGEQKLCLDGNIFPSERVMNFEVVPAAVEVFADQIK